MQGFVELFRCMNCWCLVCLNKHWRCDVCDSDALFSETKREHFESLKREEKTWTGERLQNTTQGRL